MKLRVTHRTSYHYAAPVTNNFNEVRLRPISDDPQRVEYSLVSVRPAVRLRHYRDFFQNYVHYFEVEEAHTELSIESTATIETRSQFEEGVPYGIAFTRLAGSNRDEMIYEYLQPSRFVSISPDLWRLSVDIQDRSNDVFQTAENIMRYIFREYAYSPESTNVHTHMEDVLRLKAGVCQDFAHVMLGMCRALKIPARYVSGYLFDGSGAGLRGDHASHAWAEIYLPGRGWFGLDPTNDQFADDRYIKIGVGRDYNDVAPVKGTFCGPSNASRSMSVSVKVEPAAAAAPSAK